MCKNNYYGRNNEKIIVMTELCQEMSCTEICENNYYGRKIWLKYCNRIVMTKYYDNFILQ